MKTGKLGAVLALSLVIAGCATPLEKVQQSEPPVSTSNLTLGVVQKNIVQGLSQDEVVGHLGSPNMVTRDGMGQETWIYDKISTEVVTAAAGNDQRALAGLAGRPANIIDGRSLVGAGIGSAGQYNNASSMTRTQKTLTVIIKFRDNRVADYSYRASTF